MKLIEFENLPDNFRVGLEKNFRKNVFDYGTINTGSFSKLSYLLNYSASSLREIKNGVRKGKNKISKRYIRVFLLKKLAKISDISIKYIENKVTVLISGRIPITVALPLHSSKELACILGHVFGDGHIKKKEKQLQYTNKNLDLINEFKKCIKKTFKFESKEMYRKKQKIYCLYLPSTMGKLLILIGAPSGRKTSQKLFVPIWIKEGSQEIKREFLRALFDDEGWVEIAQGGFCIGFGQNKKEYLKESHSLYIEEIKFLLKEIGINTSNIYERSKKKDSIQLGFKIIGRSNLSNFYKNIGFTSKEKLNRLIFILNNFKQIQYGKKEAKIKVLEELKDGPIKSKELAKRLNRDQKTIWKHLHQLHLKNKILKIGTKNKVFWKLK